MRTCGNRRSNERSRMERIASMPSSASAFAFARSRLFRCDTFASEIKDTDGHYAKQKHRDCEHYLNQALSLEDARSLHNANCSTRTQRFTIPIMSFPRRRESRLKGIIHFVSWIPVCTGMTLCLFQFDRSLAVYAHDRRQRAEGNGPRAIHRRRSVES